MTAVQHPQLIQLASALTPELLFCDAMTDVMTSLHSADMPLAVGTALLVELPATAVLLRNALAKA